MKECINCKIEFIFNNTDTYDDRFCTKWCEKAWHDKNYHADSAHIDV